MKNRLSKNEPNRFSFCRSTHEGRVEGKLALFRFMELDLMHDRGIGNRDWWQRFWALECFFPCDQTASIRSTWTFSKDLLLLPFAAAGYMANIVAVFGSRLASKAYFGGAVKSIQLHRDKNSANNKSSGACFRFNVSSWSKTTAPGQIIVSGYLLFYW